MRFRPHDFLLAILLGSLTQPCLAAESKTTSNPSPPNVRLLHRIFHPSQPAEPFVERGTLLLAPSSPGTGYAAAQFVPSPDATLHSYVVAFADLLHGPEAKDVDAAVYQLALEHPGDTHPSQWHVSAVKACHLAQATSESFTLHLASDGAPFAIDYFIGPVPPNGACPKQRKRKQNSAPSLEDIGTKVSNTTVVVKSPTHPPLPQLRTPPPLTPEGKPLQPPQEKTFLQKYWMYIIAAFLALAISGGAPEEEGQGGGQGK